jgi:coenzyme Q-binding protein COQ10
MPTHREERVLPYTPQQMFDLVADIGRYPDFLPWCTSATILREEGDDLIAELTIGYKFIHERFISRVTLNKKSKDIHVGYISGPLKVLRNEWQFRPDGKKKCRVHFYVHFEFANPLLSVMMNMFFDVAFRQMVSSFEKRAAQIYGLPKAR